MSEPPKPVAWDALRRATAARIGLTRSGPSLATRPLLEFALAHARARDAVHAPLDAEALAQALQPLGLPVLTVQSAVETRQDYLTRPDLGRVLSAPAQDLLKSHRSAADVVFVMGDGLSARAVQDHAAATLAALLPLLKKDALRVAPLVIARQARVALGDAIAAALNAELVVMLIGERPGLSSPDSMGAYLTWQPNAQTTDADRNCISNIRPEGIPLADAAFKIAALLRAMRTRRLSGVALKDESDRLMLEKD